LQKFQRLLERNVKTAEGLSCREFVSPGQIIAGRYQVGPLLGTSPRGTVYRATHTRLGFPVALQVLGPEVASSLTWKRFARELKALGALHNQHVVRVHDAGTLPSGARFIITEQLEGDDLATFLRKHGPLPVDKAADYVCRVCSVLGDAHRLGIVHRNVRPDNVFLARTRATEPVVKLLDFGVALFLSEPGSLTMPGCGCVSPAYLSPEQLRNPNAVDARTDLWSVGLLLFEALMGRSPFASFDNVQIFRALSEGPVPLLPLSCSVVPAGLAAIVRQCLEREPDRRPRNADEIIRALEPFSSRPGRRLRASPTGTSALG
jgi:serine/threonine-protein kinase